MGAPSAEATVGEARARFLTNQGTRFEERALRGKSSVKEQMLAMMDFFEGMLAAVF